MSDLPKNQASPEPRRPDGPESGAEALRRTSQELRAAASEVQSRAGEAAAQAGETAKDLSREAMAEGREIVDVAVHQAASVAEAQKRAGAEQAEGIARAIRRAADELQGNMPVVARYVREGADYVGQAADALRRRSPRDLVTRVEEFARAQPVAFFGAAVLAGFALARFAKSSAEAHPQGWHEAGRVGAERHGAGFPAGERGGPYVAAQQPSTASGAPGWVPGSDDRAPAGAGAAGTGGSHPATMAAATLGGKAAQEARHDDAAARPMGGEEGATPYGARLSGEQLRASPLPHRGAEGGAEGGEGTGAAPTTIGGDRAVGGTLPRGAPSGATPPGGAHSAAEMGPKAKGR